MAEVWVFNKRVGISRGYAYDQAGAKLPKADGWKPFNTIEESKLPADAQEALKKDGYFIQRRTITHGKSATVPTIYDGRKGAVKKQPSKETSVKKARKKR